MRTRLSATHVVQQFIGTRHRIPVAVRSFVMAAVFALVAGCGGGGMHASLPAVQSAPASSEMNASYPQSVSPASFNVEPMPQTQRLPASALPDALRGTAPQTIGLHYSKLSGSAVSVAGAPDGSLWALSPTPAGVNKAIWHYVSGTWTNIPGAASSIAVGRTGTLYAVNGTSGGVYAYNGSSWSSLGGGARWVAAGADGAVYVLSNRNAVNGNSAIWKYASGTWTQQPGSGSQLAGSPDPTTYSVSGVGTVAPDGYFVLNSSGGIYYYSPGSGYVQFPGTASGIAGFIGGFIALNYPASAGGEGIVYFDYGSSDSTAESGSGVRVATGAGSGGAGTNLYVVNPGNAIYESLIVSSASKIYVASGNTVTTYNAVNGTQTSPTISTLPHPQGVAIDGTGNIYVVTYGNPGFVTMYSPSGAPTGVTFDAGDGADAVAVGAAGVEKIYVANYIANSVMIFGAFEILLNTITTSVNKPTGVAVDAAGKVYVTNAGSGSLTTYTASGAQTVPTITGLNDPGDVAVDAAGKIYITSLVSGTLTTYNADGTPASLSITGLSTPTGVAVDGVGNIYITNRNSSSVTTYDSSGAAGPTITTGLLDPLGIAVH